jgi:hypothetical protein
MQGWTDGDLETVFEQRLDDPLAELCPDWQPPGLPEPYRRNQRFGAYERRNAKRIHVGELLTARPDMAVAIADRVLAAIACDEDVSCNKQLIRVDRALIAELRSFVADAPATPGGAPRRPGNGHTEPRHSQSRYGP